MPRFRIHRKFRGYDVWAYEIAPNEQTAYEQTTRKAEFIKRESIPICSIVDADKVSLREQTDQDRGKADGFYDGVAKMSEAERARALAKFEAESAEAASNIMQGKTPVDEKRAATERILAARRRRRGQVADDPGQLKEGDLLWNREGMIPEELPPEAQEQVKQYKAGQVRRRTDP